MTDVNKVSIGGRQKAVSLASLTAVGGDGGEAAGMSKGRSRSRTGIHAAVASIAIAAGLGAVGVAGARGTAAGARARRGFRFRPGRRANQHSRSRPVTACTWTLRAGGFHNVQSTDTAAGTWTPPIPDDNPIDDHPDVTHTFTAEGVYSFHCDAHIPDMNGTITVEASPRPATDPTAPVTDPSEPAAERSRPSRPPPATGTDTVKPTVQQGQDEGAPARRARAPSRCPRARP